MIESFGFGEYEFIKMLALAVVQGVTEWLPISSSGHLVIFEKLLGVEAGLDFEIALHFGTLMAVFVYFGKDVTDIIRDFCLGKWKSENGRMGWLLVVASIPAGIFGYLFLDFFKGIFNSLGVTAMGFAVTSIVLFIASLEFSKNRKKEKKLSVGGAFLIGCAQVLSILPGVSRAGMTTSAGLLLGLNEKNALRFSFLMAIPVIFGANLIVFKDGSLSPGLIWASIVSFITALIVIHVLFKYALKDRKNLRWFAFYTFMLAVSLGLWLLIG